MNYYSQVTYLCGAHNLNQCPPDHGFEVAFAGRSNVGKSSVINTLTGTRKLARTSKVPGRTQLLNFFRVTDDARLVDLPGYGFAKVPEKVRQHWGKLMQGYFEQRQSLAGLVLVMDIRHPLRPFDEQMLDWCSTASLPVCVLLNKSDKLSRGGASSVLESLKRQLAGNGSQVLLFSSQRPEGRNRLQAQLDLWFGFQGEKKTAPVCHGEGGHSGAK